MDIFEQATIQKLRFASSRGDLTVEQLWDLPLQSKTSFDLDTLAKATNAELKALAEESFVTTAASPAKDKIELRLALLKHIIAAKLAQNEARRKAAENAAEKARLIALLGEKQDEALRGLTADEIKARIAALE